MFHQDRIRAALEFEAKKAQQEMEKERKKRQVHFCFFGFLCAVYCAYGPTVRVALSYEEWTHRLTRRIYADLLTCVACKERD
jgi:hypothetical protein